MKTTDDPRLIDPGRSGSEPDQSDTPINRLDNVSPDAPRTATMLHGANASGNGSHPTPPAASRNDRPARAFNDAGLDELAKLAAMAEGDQTGQLSSSVSAAQKASEHGERKAAENMQVAVAAEKADVAAKLVDVRAELKRTEPKRKVPGKRRSMGFIALLGLLVSTLALALFIYVENYGVGMALTDIGAFAVSTVGKGMLLSATAVTVGLAMAKGYPNLPPHWRRRAFCTACVALAMLFAVYLIGFTLGAKDSGAQSSAGFGLAGSGAGGSASLQGTGVGAWLMLFGVLGMMPLTSFIGSVSIKAFLDSFETWEAEPDYVRLETQENLHLGSLASLDARDRDLAVTLSRFEDEEGRKVNLAMQRYLAWKSHFAGRCAAPPPLAVLMLAGMLAYLLTGCDESGGGGSPALRRMGGGDVAARAGEGPPQRVVAASPRLEDAMREQVAALIEHEAEFLSTNAPVRSSAIIMDALRAQPVAELTAVQGVTKIRRRALMPQVAAVKGFLDKVPRRSEQDAQMHIPRLAEVLAQGKLQPGTHVVMLGNPCWHTEKGADAFYSMKERYPSDGFLFEEPRDSVWSIKGREKRLAGLLIHMGYPSDDVFVDESHREAIRRFYALYFQHQGASLVSFQPSFDAAMQAAREGMSDPVMEAEADDKAQPMMIKIVRREKELVIPQEQRATGEGADKGAGADARGEPRLGDETHETNVAEVKPPEVKLDEHGNPQGAEHDLGGKDALRGQRVMVVIFDYDPDIEGSPLSAALRAKGASVEMVRYPLPQPAAWRAMLEVTDQLWLWSSEEKSHLAKPHLDAMVERWRAGKLALCLLSDNVPYVQEAGKVLATLVLGSRITGDYRGEKILLARSGKAGPGFDATTPIFTGLEKVFEGNTISTISGNGLTPVCWASDGQPLLVTFQQGSSSRLVAFGGYTSFYQRFWDEAGTARLAANLSGWLAGLDKNGQQSRQ